MRAQWVGRPPSARYLKGRNENHVLTGPSVVETTTAGEGGGVEPASPELLVGLLRAQPLEDVTHRHVNGIVSAGHPRFNVPISPEALLTGEPSWMTPRRDE